MKYLLSIVIFTTTLLSAGVEKPLMDNFSKLLMEEKFTECLDLIDHMDDIGIYDKGTILGLKSSVYFSLRDMQNALTFLQASTDLLEDERSSKLQALANEFIFNTSSELAAYSGSRFPGIVLLRDDRLSQPKGIKFRYWMGIGQILAGIVTTPFSGGAGSALILSGLATTVSAGGDAMDNKEEWERRLNHHEREDGKSPERTSENYQGRNNTLPVENMGHFWDTNRPKRAIIDHDQLMNKELKKLIFI